MAHLTRPRAWYEGWMVGDVQTEAERAGRKRDVAGELVRVIAEGHFDSETLQEMILLLDHECLCFEPVQDPSIAEQPPSSALKTPSADKILDTLEECLVRSIGPTSHFERELQARALMSALALLHGQGVRAFASDRYEKLRDKFRKLFEDLQWSRIRGPFSREKYRQFQCAYLLCSASEYANYFGRAQPRTVTALSRLTNLLFAGASVTAVAITVRFICHPFTLVKQLTHDRATQRALCGQP